MLKIMEAAKRFNASQNTLFTTYAVIRIRFSMKLETVFCIKKTEANPTSTFFKNFFLLK